MQLGQREELMKLPRFITQIQQIARFSYICSTYPFFSSFFSLLCNYFKVNLRHFAYIFYTIHYMSLKHVDFFLYNHNAIVIPSKINHFSLVSFNNQSVIRFSEMSSECLFTDALFQSEYRGGPLHLVVMFLKSFNLEHTILCYPPSPTPASSLSTPSDMARTESVVL